MGGLRIAACFALFTLACGGDSGDDGGAFDAGTGVTDAPTGPIADAGPDASTEPTCTFNPTGEFNPGIECTWNGPAVGSKYGDFDDVVMTPVVINMTDDNGDGVVDTSDIPDIAFVSYPRQTGDGVCPADITCGCCNAFGVLRVVSGGCGSDGTLQEHFVVGADEILADIGIADVWLDNSGGLALGDIDADGSVDIVATLRGGGTIAFERTGTVKWLQQQHPAAGADHLAGTQPSIADIDADGKPEVIQGRVVLNGEDGSLQWQGTLGVGTNGFMGPVSSVGDLDLNGELNVLAGATFYQANGVGLWSYPFPVPIVDTTICDHRDFPCDGFTATGNFDDDDEGELVIVRAGTIYLANHSGAPMQVGGQNVEIAIPLDDCVRNEGGPPTVADFDGDGEPEIGVAGADFYIVADLECLATPLPAQCSDPGIRWKIGNDDCSSRVTGSSVFDFDGDGRAEVVYADEVEFRILDGVDGSERLSIPNFSHTRLEMPIVVDVDNDGNAEIVFVENLNGEGTSQGIRVYGDQTDSWVATRRVWNQHSYHVTNVSELGAIPVVEPTNWLAPTEATVSGVMNNFRQNLPEADALAAPDLTVSLGFTAATCGLDATVCNAGDIVVGAGVQVRFYDNADQSEIPCDNAPVVTTIPLAPGECETATCVWSAAPDGNIDIRACVDNAGYECAGAGMGGNNECDEDNNRADESTDFSCDPIE